MKEKTIGIILNKKEKEILKLLAGGFSDSEIGEELGKSYHTIRGVIYDMERRTGTTNRPHLIYWAFKNGVLRVE